MSPPITDGITDIILSSSSSSTTNLLVNGQQRRLSQDDDAYSYSETSQLLNSFYINLIIFACLIGLFELLRHQKSIYMNRLTRKFIHANRVPAKPNTLPFGWVWAIIHVSEEDVLRMVGLDGYMLLRYLIACFRIASFFSFWGVLVMVPVYANGGKGLAGWNKYTIGNISDNDYDTGQSLWTPVAFCYLFVIFFCQIMYFEYKNFIHKRVQYLVDGDLDTQVQTYYTIMIEHIPSSIRSTPVLKDFFERLFPGQVYAVEIALDLTELQELSNQRKKIRNLLEKSVAIEQATSHRPTVWVKSDFYNGLPDAPKPIKENTKARWFGYEVYDAIDHYSKLLDILNDNVHRMQKEYFRQRQKMDRMEISRLREIRKSIAVRAITTGAMQVRTIASNITNKTKHAITESSKTVADFAASSVKSSSKARNSTESNTSSSSQVVNPMAQAEPNSERHSHEEIVDDVGEEEIKEGTSQGRSSSEKPSDDMDHKARAKEVLGLGAKMVGSGVGGLAKEGLKTAEYATKGALRGVLEATRALELLTIGAYYKISTTAFITFKSRVAKCSSQQMLLSHDHYMMDVLPAPNPKDIIWENVSIPQQQIKMRTSISHGTLVVGALFWSIVVAFISAVSNLESISQEIPALQEYSNTDIYKFFNNYLAIVVLLILLSLLPFLFDFISRSYEGLKLESEIQNSIMTRYFYYQLANVFVSVGLGSIANSIHQILQNPSSILTILGNSVPSFSIYFATLIITRTFTGIPIEMLRIFPLLEILTVKLCKDKKKCTRRELRNGAFADPPMDYGWIYPNILMVLMIMVTYCCIAPFILPLCTVFFMFVYLMYKYQLLYVYINAYQSGGYMWYAVFDRSMLALVCGVFTLLCYLAIRQTYMSGPFYAILPLPPLIILFWRHCNSKFQVPAKNLSLERAIEIDKAVKERAEHDLTVPHDTFSQTLFRQPALAEGRLRPAPYRSHARTKSENGVRSNSSSTPSLDFDNRESVESHRQYCINRDSDQQYNGGFEDEEDIEDHMEREAAVDAFLNDSNNINSTESEQSKSERSSGGAVVSESGRILDDLEANNYGSIEEERSPSLAMKTFN